MLELKYYVDPVDPQTVEALLLGSAGPRTESFNQFVDLTPVKVTLDKLLEGDEMKVAAWDAELAPSLHTAFSGCERRLLLDMRLWHWLALEPLSAFVLRRWCGVRTVAERGQPLAPAERDHFLGRPTLNGFNRNAIARLYWAADALYTTSGKYELLNAVMAHQDLLTGIFERFFSLYAPAARACVSVLKDLDEDERRARLKNLNLVASTISLETLEQSDIEKLLVPTAA
ncbi:MAG: DUF6339 family protein [Acidimicrobiales bacterium]